ncbi:MAG: MFS transporter [Akkermansiaceae bacterium]|jgi:maltose/moltooligosaccharide transporter|tara:strand:+ start:18454 stop:20142 length:1689 start_codon:yes stop_codon:yes gene_type:complete
MNEKPRLSFWQIWNMSFGFFGIQFGWGLQMANMSAIYQFLGAEESELPLLWLAAPLTGLIIQPIIGYYSDRTWNRMGRRRPFFLIGAILASIALIFMPMSSTLWMAAGLLWVLDASVNVSMEPFRAFVGDMLPATQRKVGFTMQSILIGAGAVLASILPFVLKNGFAVSGEATSDSAIPPAIKIAFFIGAGVFFASVLYTILTTREYPPEDMEEFKKMKAEGGGIGHAFAEIFQGIGSMPKAMKKLAPVQFFTWLGLFCMWIFFTPAVGKKIFSGIPLGVHDDAVHQLMKDDPSSLAVALAVTDLYENRKEVIEAEDSEKPDTSSTSDTMLTMFGLKKPAPSAAEKITTEELSGFFATSASATTAPDEDKAENPLIQTIAGTWLAHKNDPTACAAELEGHLQSARDYQTGTGWAGVCFAVYNLVAFIFAFLLLAIVRIASAKMIHLGCMLCGGAGLVSTMFVTDPNMLLVSMAGVGIAWASILSMPYAMLSNSVPGNKMGFYMGVFNLFIVIPQIIASVGFGPIVKTFFGGDPMKAVTMGGVSLLIAAACTLFADNDEAEAS